MNDKKLMNRAADNIRILAAAMVEKANSGHPCGAVVVASGAEDIAVRLRLQEAVTTLLGLDSSRVAVYPRKGGNAP